jgi:phospholipase C
MDEHPKAHIQSGAAYIARAFNAFMQGPLWTKSAMFLTYDEAGGFYDHVTPPAAPPPDGVGPRLLAGDTQGAFDRYGFRVPLVAVSPFVKPNYVSHQVSDHTSILKFIERRFGLPALTERDKAAVDLTDMFDFTKMSFEQPPKMPNQPTGGTCNFSLVDNR